MTPEQIEALKVFAKGVITAGWEGDCDEFFVQELAFQQALTVRVECTEENRSIWEEIDGMEDCEPGDHFYQLAPWLRGKSA